MTSVWTASARGFRAWCPTCTSASVWWCAICATGCATQKTDEKGLVGDHRGNFRTELEGHYSTRVRQALAGGSERLGGEHR